jgi:hypothetical protein
MSPLEIHGNKSGYPISFHVYNLCEENEGTLQIIGIFRSPRDRTLKTCLIVPKTERDLDSVKQS